MRSQIIAAVAFVALFGLWFILLWASDQDRPDMQEYCDQYKILPEDQVHRIPDACLLEYYKVQDDNI